MSDTDFDLDGLGVDNPFWGLSVTGSRSLEAGERALIKEGSDLFERTSEFVASTETEARDGLVIEQRSWRLAEYRRNPVFLDNHDPTAVIGRSEVVKIVESTQLRNAVLWDEAEDNPRAALVAGQHRRRMRNAVSVRWMGGQRIARDELPENHPFYRKPIKRQSRFGIVEHAGWYLRRANLLEISSVSVAGDARALQTRSPLGMLDELPDRGLAGAIEDHIRAALETPELLHDDGLIQSFRALLLRFLRTDDEVSRACALLSIPDTPDHEPPAPFTGWWDPRNSP